jgi:hypothetical protein
MNTITHLRRISPLALILVALAAVLALTPAAHAQSTQTVQLKRDTGLAATALPDGTIGFAVDNNNDFKQKWTKTLVNSQTKEYRFSRFGFVNGCIKVPDNLSSQLSDTIKLGSCSGPRALWRETSAPGGKKVYRNPQTGHYMVPGICFGIPGCVEKMDAVDKQTVDAFGGPFAIAALKVEVLSTP